MNWITTIFSKLETQSEYTKETYFNGDLALPDKYV